jgi:hypothetical protein
MVCLSRAARVTAVFFTILVPSLLTQAHAASPAGLLALYDFSEGGGAVVHDLSGVDTPMDLRIADTSNTRWLPGGGLEVFRPTVIASSGAATRLSEEIKASNEITIEAWVQPSSTGQSGPARIVTLSSNTKQRNFTLGQERTAYDVRLRTTQNSDNGSKPSVTTPSGALNTALTHVVYTRDSNGSAAIYVNGVRQVGKTVSGEFDNWDSAYRFALVNELSGDRPWLGTLHRVAIYNRVLGGSEIDQSFAAGAQPDSATTAADSGAPAAGDSTADAGSVTEGTESIQPDTGTTTSEPTTLTGAAELNWTPPATRSNGDPLSFAEIAGYTLYYGVAPGNYSNSISIDDASTTSVSVADLPLGTYYFAVTARDTGGRESALSTPAIRVVD